MSHKLLRLTEKLYNTPHLIHPQSMDNILNYLDERNSGKMAISSKDVYQRPEMQFVDETAVAVIPVAGSLTYEEDEWGALCGSTSYQGVMRQMKEAISLGASVVVLDVDSGGGEAYGAFETAVELRKLADANKVSLVAYVDGMSASAAYALSAAADMVVANPQSEVGSIGVLVQLRSMSDEDKKRTKFVFAGDNKIPFDGEGEFTQSFLDGIQQKVDVLYEGFVSHIASLRGIEEAVVKNTQASVFMADEALGMGLVDAVQTREEFYTFLSNLVNKETY